MRQTLVAIAIFILVSTPFAGESNYNLESLSWLSGYWQNQAESGTTEECWLHSGPDDMLGMHRSRNQNGGTFLEYLKIEKTPQGIVYIAYPSGQEKTVFKLTDIAENKVIFTNPAHDFPQTIVYWLDNHNILHARINGSQNGRTISREWIFNKSVSQ